MNPFSFQIILTLTFDTTRSGYGSKCFWAPAESTVASQPAAQVDLFLFMAVNAKPHFEVLSFDAVLGLHNTMTGLAFDAEADVPLVVEKHMFRNIIDFYPGC